MAAPLAEVFSECLVAPEFLLAATNRLLQWKSKPASHRVIVQDFQAPAVRLAYLRTLARFLLKATGPPPLLPANRFGEGRANFYEVRRCTRSVALVLFFALALRTHAHARNSKAYFCGQPCLASCRLP
jgi:hypothetical protein